MISRYILNPASLIILVYLPQLILMFSNKKFSQNFNNTIVNSKKDYNIEIIAAISLSTILILAYFSNASQNSFHLKLGTSLYLIGLIGTYIGYFNFLKSKPDKLVTNGIFSFSRNPTYLFASIAILGISTLTNSFILLLLTLIHFYSTNQIVKKEEKFLAKKFKNKFENYKKQTPRYF